MEPLTAQMSDVTLLWLWIIVLTCVTGLLAVSKRQGTKEEPRRRSFEDAYLDKLSNTDF